MNREIPQHYVTSASEQIEISEDQFGRYHVDCWTGEDENRWHKEFDKQTDAFIEFDKWQHLKAR